MKKWPQVLMLFLFVAGCVSLDEQAGTQAFYNPRAEKLLDLSRIQTGMDYEQVQAIVARPVVIGYDITADGSGSVKEITLSNPYRVETLNHDNKNYTVEHFIVQIVRADGTVSDDELMPLVFEDNILIGKGQDFLFKLKD